MVRDRTMGDGSDRPCLGRKISEEEFIRNYIDHVYELEATKKKAEKGPEPVPDAKFEDIYNPVCVTYTRIVKHTEKARLFQFEDGVTYWFPRSVSIVDKKKKILTIPLRFTNETALLDYAVRGYRRS